MNTPDQPIALPLDYAAKIVFELHSMRGECSEFTKGLIEQSPLDEANLDECARLDEALAQAHHVLAREVEAIRAGQAKRKRTST